MEKKHLSDISILRIREFTLHIAILYVTSLGRYSLYVAVRFGIYRADSVNKTNIGC